MYHVYVMDHAFDAWQVNVVINNEPGLKSTLEFVGKLGAVESFKCIGI